MTKTIAMSVGLALALLAGRGQAQQPAPQKTDLRRDSSSPSTTSQTAATPEMWLYQQERDRYEDPRLAVRRKAELRAAQRNDRLAAMKWFGQSNSRPLVSATPHTDTYGAGWVSDSPNPYQWRGGSSPSVVVRPNGSLY